LREGVFDELAGDIDGNVVEAPWGWGPAARELVRFAEYRG
jgi:hypothetical protein